MWCRVGLVLCVSKLCSTTALRKAIQSVEKASEVAFCHLCGYRIGSVAEEEESTQSLPFAKHHVRRCMSNGLHHRWCEGGDCYSVSEECVCVLAFVSVCMGR